MRADKSGKLFGLDPRKNVEVELWVKQVRRLESLVTVADVLEGHALLSQEEYAEQKRMQEESSSEEEDDEDAGDAVSRKQAKQAKLSFAAASALCASPPTPAGKSARSSCYSLLQYYCTEAKPQQPSQRAKRSGLQLFRACRATIAELEKRGFAVHAAISTINASDDFEPFFIETTDTIVFEQVETLEDADAHEDRIIDLED